MTTAPTSRRTRPAKAPLSREVIVHTGLRILDRDGLDALTMRRVAQELDTGPASLYVYVDNRDDLMAAMLDEALGQVTLPDANPDAGEAGAGAVDGESAGAGTGTWQERLRTLVAAAIDAVSRHEGLALAALGAIPTGLNALLVVDRLLALLKEGGLDDATAAWAVDLIHLHIIATAAEQSAYNAKGSEEKVHVAEVDRRFAALAADQYPMITSLRADLLSGGDRATWGMNVLINGILHTPARPDLKPQAQAPHAPLG